MFVTTILRNVARLLHRKQVGLLRIMLILLGMETNGDVSPVCTKSPVRKLSLLQSTVHVHLFILFYLFIYLWIPQRLVYSINLSRGSPCMYMTLYMYMTFMTFTIIIIMFIVHDEALVSAFCSTSSVSACVFDRES